MTAIRRSVFLCVLLAMPSSALYAQADSAFAISVAGASVFRVNKDGALVARGTFGTGSSPASGAGTRMMWDPHKAAFRAGRTSDFTTTAWDDANVGLYSVALGWNTIASGTASVALGTGAISSGINSFAMGNNDTEASNSFSFAYGRFATADGFSSIALGYDVDTNGHRGVFLWGDDPDIIGSIHTLKANADGQFLVRASGGVRFFTSADTSSGVSVPAGGGTWSSISDRNRKENFVFPEGEGILAKLRLVPVSTWNYRTQDASIRHMGPMAQDLYAAFGLGESNLMISSVDIDGINMAGVQAVAARTDQLRAENATQAARISALEAENIRLRARLERIEALIIKQSISERRN